MSINLQELSDRLAIRELADRYAVSVTCRDWAALGACFHEDAAWTVVGSGLAFKGREAIAAGIRGAVEPNAFHMLMPHAFVIDTLTADRATARGILHEVFKRPGGDTGAKVLGVYTDVITKSEGAWLFADRRFDIYLMDGSGTPGQVMVDYSTLAVAQ
jgi:uncharacterized protein (TIGR02246 family)